MKDKLLQMAKEIKQADSVCIEEYNQKRKQLVEKINNIMLNRPDLKELIGDNNIDIMKDNHSNHTRFVQSILTDYNPEVLIDTVAWVYRAYRSRGFHTTYWSAQINSWIDILKESLSEETFKAFYPLYNWFCITIPLFTNMSDKELSEFNSNVTEHSK